jgi:hypothetical protein
MSDAHTIDELMDDAALMSYEYQEHSIGVLGAHSWHLDFDPPKFEFTGDHPLVCSRFHYLGSAAPGPGTWLWSWADSGADYPPAVTELAERVRDHGVRHGIPALSQGEVPFDELPGSPSRPNRVAWLMGELAKAVTGCWTWYSGDAGRGTRLAVLIEHPDLVPPAPTARSVRRVMDGVHELGLPDHKRALHSYAVRRGLNADFTDGGTKLMISGPGLTAAIRFNERGQVTAMSTSSEGDLPRVSG